VLENIFNKPEDFFNLEKLRKAVQLDRRLTLREILEKIFGLIPRFKSKEELLEEECQKFISIYKPPSDYVLPVKNFIKAYVTDPRVREIVESRRYADFATSPVGEDFRGLNKELRKLIPEYVKDYIPLNKYIA
jgi:type I restriction enzyme R subunit